MAVGGDAGGGGSPINVVVRVRPHGGGGDVEEDAQGVAVTRNGRVCLRHPYLAEERVWDTMTAVGEVPSGTPAKDRRAASQAAVYDALGRSIVTSMFDGINNCVFAYGTTQSGKTYTLLGDPDGAGDAPAASEAGLLPRVCSELLRHCDAHNTCADGASTCVVEASMYELTPNKVHDLLAEERYEALTASRRPADLRVREHPHRGPYVEGVRVVTISRPCHVDMLLDIANHKGKGSHLVADFALVQEWRDPDIDTAPSIPQPVKKTPARPASCLQRRHTMPVRPRTSAPEGSGSGSRRASVRNVPLLLRRSPSRGAQDQRLASILGILSALPSRRLAGSDGDDGDPFTDPAPGRSLKSCTLTVCDLAGVQPVPKQRRMAPPAVQAAVAINKSLSALSRVMSLLGEGKAKGVVPHRDSVLTWLLKDKLSGNCSTQVVVTVAPAACEYEATLSSLLFAERAKKIVSRPVVGLWAGLRAQGLRQDETRSLLNIRRLLEDTERLHAKRARLQATLLRVQNRACAREAVPLRHSDSAADGREGPAALAARDARLKTQLAEWDAAAEDAACGELAPWGEDGGSDNGGATDETDIQRELAEVDDLLDTSRHRLVQNLNALRPQRASDEPRASKARNIAQPLAGNDRQVLLKYLGPVRVAQLQVELQELETAEGGCDVRHSSSDDDVDGPQRFYRETSALNPRMRPGGGDGGGNTDAPTSDAVGAAGTPFRPYQQQCIPLDGITDAAGVLEASLRVPPSAEATVPEEDELDNELGRLYRRQSGVRAPAADEGSRSESAAKPVDAAGVEDDKSIAPPPPPPTEGEVRRMLENGDEYNACTERDALLRKLQRHGHGAPQQRRMSLHEMVSGGTPRRVLSPPRAPLDGGVAIAGGGVCVRDAARQPFAEPVRRTCYVVCPDRGRWAEVESRRASESSGGVCTPLESAVSSMATAGTCEAHLAHSASDGDTDDAEVEAEVSAGGLPPEDVRCEDLRTACDLAGDGDEILVMRGTHDGAVVLTKAVTLRAYPGDAPDTVVLQSHGSAPTLTIRGHAVVSGVTLRHHRGDACVHLAGGCGAVQCCAIASTASGASVLCTDGHHLVEGCTVSSHGIGLWVRDRSRVTARRNTLRRCGDCAVVVEGVLARPLIEDNDVVDSRGGGVVVAQRGRGRVVNNRIRGNNCAGVLVEGGADPTCEGNAIDGNSGGGLVVCGRGTRGSVKGNAFAGNKEMDTVVRDHATPRIEANTYEGRTIYGAVFCHGGGGLFLNNTLRGYSGHAILVRHGGGGLIFNNTIIAPDGAAGGCMLSGHSRGVVVNNMFWADEVHTRALAICTAEHIGYVRRNSVNKAVPLLSAAEVVQLLVDGDVLNPASSARTERAISSGHVTTVAVEQQ